ncbi:MULTISPECIES: hypothetical protein [unclassified Leptolyngbya]|uniref:hypothetical protein n=1 Tax=unclassified Leptolyngbya TaxID=2650499 RepID=UPI0016828E29|nr:MULTISPECIES: hypothetical protein [unclassified Leptolyngbya]MBD1909778.1 hypothetical protein [Leptolyngbya sp. FACHB-8]MBD2157677.1 hypothetical protein [Leptolyngbya sp. FACHB-16]
MTKDLAHFQSTLLEILAASTDADGLLLQLQQEEFSQQWTDYIATFELPMVEVAAELVRKWGKRSADVRKP